MMVECEHFAGSSHAGLHLIDDEHDAVLITDTPKLADKRRRSGNVATFTLHYLENDPGNFFSRSSCHEQTFLYPVDDVTRDGCFIGRQIGCEVPELVWIGYMDNI